MPLGYWRAGGRSPFYFGFCYSPSAIPERDRDSEPHTTGVSPSPKLFGAYDTPFIGKCLESYQNHRSPEGTGSSCRLRSRLPYEESGAAATARSRAAPQQLRTFRSPTVSNQGRQIISSGSYAAGLFRCFNHAPQKNDRITWTTAGHNSARPVRRRSDVDKVQRGERTVCQHPVKRLTGRAVRPAGHPETRRSGSLRRLHR